jgi:hypothetical protein
MRNMKLIVAMLAGCMAFGGTAMAQDAASKPAPTPASTAGSQTHTSNDSMKMDSNSSMSGDSKAADSSGAMKSTHKKHKKAATTTGTEPAKSSSSGM